MPPGMEQWIGEIQVAQNQRRMLPPIFHSFMKNKGRGKYEKDTEIQWVLD